MKHIFLACTLYLLCACGMTLSKRTSSTKWSIPINTDTLQASVQKGTPFDSLYVKNKSVHLLLPIPESDHEDFAVWRRTPQKIFLRNQKGTRGLLFRIRDSAFVLVRVPTQK